VSSLVSRILRLRSSVKEEEFAEMTRILEVSRLFSEQNNSCC
jgi:hypothetical protein